MADLCQWFNEFPELDGTGVNAAEVEVFLLDSGALMTDAMSQVACFGTQKEIEDELYAVGLIRNV